MKVEVVSCNYLGILLSTLLKLIYYFINLRVTIEVTPVRVKNYVYY